MACRHAWLHARSFETAGKTSRLIVCAASTSIAIAGTHLNDFHPANPLELGRPRLGLRRRRRFDRLLLGLLGLLSVRLGLALGLGFRVRIALSTRRRLGPLGPLARLGLCSDTLGFLGRSPLDFELRAESFGIGDGLIDRLSSSARLTPVPTHIPDGLATRLELGQELGVVLLPLQRHALEQRRDLVEVALGPRMSSEARILLDRPLLRLELRQIERERSFRGLLARSASTTHSRTHRRLETRTSFRSDPIIVLIAAGRYVQSRGLASRRLGVLERVQLLLAVVVVHLVVVVGALIPRHIVIALALDVRIVRLGPQLDASGRLPTGMLDAARPGAERASGSSQAGTQAPRARTV